MRFREATPADVPVLVALIESAYRGDASRSGWTTEAEFLDGRRTDEAEVLACIGKPRSMMLVAETDRVVACAYVCEEKGAGYFGMFSVIPTLQGGGIGSKVLVEAERIVREEWQLSAMRMAVIDLRTELLAYYERRGYVRTKETRRFPYEDVRSIPKRDDLAFAILEKRL